MSDDPGMADPLSPSTTLRFEALDARLQIAADHVTLLVLTAKEGWIGTEMPLRVWKAFLLSSGLQARPAPPFPRPSSD